jgi:hypothetical protein
MPVATPMKFRMSRRLAFGMTTSNRLARGGVEERFRRLARGVLQLLERRLPARRLGLIADTTLDLDHLRPPPACSTDRTRWRGGTRGARLPTGPFASSRRAWSRCAVAALIIARSRAMR